MFGYLFYVFVRISFFTPQPENYGPGIAEVKTLADNAHNTQFHFFLGRFIADNFSDDGG
jgi:hypothetical protein